MLLFILNFKVIKNHEKTLSSMTFFNIDNKIIIMFLEQHISI